MSTEHAVSHFITGDFLFAVIVPLWAMMGQVPGMCLCILCYLKCSSAPSRVEVQVNI